MNTCIWFCRTAPRVPVIAIAAWLSCGASGFADDDALLSSSAPQATESDTLGAVWKQLVATRQEVAQLRREADDNIRRLATLEDLKRQLAETSAKLASGIQQGEAAELEKIRLQQQVTALRERVAPVPALEAEVQRLQTEVNRLAKALAEAQTENAILVGARELMLKMQVQNQLDQDAVLRAAENKVESLQQERETLAKALAGTESRIQQELAARQAGFAAKDKALAKMESQIREFKAEAEKSATRIVEIEQQRARENEQGVAAAKELKKNLNAERARTAAREKERDEYSQKASRLEKALEKDQAQAREKKTIEQRQATVEKQLKAPEPENATMAKLLDALEQKWTAKVEGYQKRLEQEKARALQQSQESGERIEADTNRSSALEQERAKQDEELQQLRKKIADALEQAHKDGR